MHMHTFHCVCDCIVAYSDDIYKAWGVTQNVLACGALIYHLHTTYMYYNQLASVVLHPNI